MGDIGYIFNVIFTFPIFNGLTLLYYLFHDFGLAIIVLTIIIKLLLFPLTVQQLKSMKATQAVQPKMAEIKKKYAKDQQAQARAMQELYKAEGINPLGGCLPLLIQMPVLYGMYNAFNSVVRANSGEQPAAHLKRLNEALYPLVPHFQTFPNLNLNWFTFLNPNWHISLATPDPTFILPVLAAAATFVQLRMSMARAASNAPANDPSTQSMKMMQYIMPLFTLYLGWSFPAGLALYWTVSTIFQGVQQYFVTGWGSLLTIPKLSGDANNTSNGDNNKKKSVQTAAINGKSYNGDSKKERELLARAEAEAPEVAVSDDEENEDGPIGSRLHTPTRGGSGPSQYTRRRQGSSASARRRSNAQKSRR